MITVATAENALKYIYLETIKNDIDNKSHPLLAMLNGRALITNSKNCVNSDRELNNLYATLQISDKSLRVINSSPDLLSNLLSSECENLIAFGTNDSISQMYGWLTELGTPIKEMLTQEQIEEYGIDIIIYTPDIRKHEFNKLINQVILPGNYYDFKGFYIDNNFIYTDINAIKKVLNKNGECIEKYNRAIYINTNKLKLSKLCDWTWLSNEDGTILKQQTGKAAYMATLVKYANITSEENGIFIYEEKVGN